MTTAQAATSNFVRNAPVLAEGVAQNDRQRATSEMDKSASRDDAFATLIETFRLSESINAADITSSLPSEMFEEGGQSTIEKQREESDAKYRDQALSGLSDARFDRSSLQARLDTVNKATAESRADAETGASNRLVANESNGSTSANTLGSKNDIDSNESLKIAEAQMQRASGIATDANGKSDATGSKNIDLTASQNAAAISTNASSATGAIVSSDGRPGGSIAQQIGQLLGSQRSGESAGVRSLSSAAVVAPSDAGQAGANRSQDSASSRISTKEDQASLIKQAEEPTSSDFSKLVRSLKLQAGEHQSSARLLLRPPELGRVVVDVRMEGDTIQIDVQAETQEGWQLLTERAAQLRQALEDVGVELDRMSVMISDQTANMANTGHNGGINKSSDRLADSQVLDSEDIEPWLEQPEELLVATLKATRRKLGLTDRARLDVRA